MNPRRFFASFFLISLNLLAGVVLFYFFKPVANWYLGRVPALGVDLYNNATYVAYHLKHFSLPFNSFKDIWFGGYPLIGDFPQLSYYLMIPFAAHLGAPVGVQMYAMASLFLLLFFSYLLFLQLSKNHGLALFLAVLVLLSPNIYGAATWAGSIPYFSSQAFFPLGLLFGAKYLEKQHARYLALMILVTGIGILIHPLGIMAFLVPSLLIIILMGGLMASLPFGRILRNIFFYITGFMLTSLSFTYDYIVTTLVFRRLPTILAPTVSSGSGGLSPTEQAIASFYRDQVALTFTKTNHWLFIALAVGVILFVFTILFAKNKKKAFVALPVMFIVAYTIAHPAVNLAGIVAFLRHDPIRAFWPIPIAVGALAAVVWGYFFTTLREKLAQGKVFTKVANVILAFGTTLGFAILAYLVFTAQVTQVIERVDVSSEVSSAYPEILSIKLKKEELEEVKKQVVPSFMDPNDKNKRLYTADATVNIWWNSFFDMPLARGYIDPPIGTTRRYGIFWLDIAIANDTLVRDFDVQPEVAYNNTLFLIDWNGIYYFEGGRLGSKGPSPPPSSYLLENNIFENDEEVTTYGAILKWQTESGKPELHMEVPQTLRFFKIKDEFTSPVLYPTNAPAVIFFGDSASYEDLLRILAIRNINSRKLIPVYGGEFIDGVGSRELEAFDAVLASQYRYRSQTKAFKLLEHFIENGGNLFIDTGGEVKEAESSQLPSLFPIATSQRQGMGRFWDLTIAEHEITEEIDFSTFGPPVYGEGEWKLSVPVLAEDVREGSTVLVSHKDFPLLVAREFGEGQVVWSGMNLLYHFDQYKSPDEAQLVINMLTQLTSLDEHEPLDARVEWRRPEKVILATDEKARGILFKEEGYDGWSARLTSHRGKKLPIYLTGPTYPGFMYVPIPETVDGPFTLQFSYHGRAVHWLVAFVSFLVILFILESILFEGRLVGKRVNALSRKAAKKIGSWWEKEEEY